MFRELVSDVCDELAYRKYQARLLSYSGCLRLLSPTSYRLPFPPSPVGGPDGQEDDLVLASLPQTSCKDRHPQRDKAQAILAGLGPDYMKDLAVDVCREFDRRFLHFRELEAVDLLPHEPPLSFSRVVLPGQTSRAQYITGVTVDCTKSTAGLEQRSRRTSIVSGNMPIADIISILERHKCQNVTDELDFSRCSPGPVGGGGFSDVYWGRLRNGNKIAIKCPRVFIRADRSSRLHLKETAKELHVWSKYKHPNIIQLLGFTVFQNRIAMVSPWMKHGTLNEYLLRVPNANRCRLCREVVEAVTYLHDMGTVHGDIKAPNVLITRDGTAKLADFGNARLRNGTLRFTGEYTASQLSTRWTAPELLTDGDDYTLEADIYALGMTILETISGMVPFSNIKTDPAVIGRVTIQKEVPDRPQSAIPLASKQGNDLWGLLTLCWSYDPKMRPKATYVKSEIAKITPNGLCVAI
ncbi:hypothetical protein FRC12_014095 [Ceratobasidium sp. 428]|nr:hypothetical protein FRC12_014095 [Ceratobasidium sp. 428]